MARVTEEIHYGEYGVYGKEVVFSTGKSKVYIYVLRGNHANPVLVLAETAKDHEIQHAIARATERLQDLLFAALQEKIDALQSSV